MQNQLSIDVQLTHDARQVSDKFVTANALVVSVDSEGRSSKAWIDCVGFNGKGAPLAQLKKGDTATLIGHLDSNRRDRNGQTIWQIRFVVDGVKPTTQQLSTDEAS